MSATWCVDVDSSDADADDDARGGVVDGATSDDSDDEDTFVDVPDLVLPGRLAAAAPPPVFRPFDGIVRVAKEYAPPAEEVREQHEAERGVRRYVRSLQATLHKVNGRVSAPGVRGWASEQ